MVHEKTFYTKSNTTAFEYLKEHWVAMVLTAIPATLVALVTIFGYILSVTLDYQALKSTVEAQSVTITQLDTNQTVLLQQLSAVRQSQKDNALQVTAIQQQVNNIFNIVK